MSSLSGLVFWNPNQLQLGTHDVVIRATDDRGLFTDQSFTVTVGADTTGPQVTVQVSETVINIGDTVRINVAAFDDVAVTGVTLTIDGVEYTLDVAVWRVLHGHHRRPSRDRRHGHGQQRQRGYGTRGLARARSERQRCPLRRNRVANAADFNFLPCGRCRHRNRRQFGVLSA